jgi:hypothetical protein
VRNDGARHWETNSNVFEGKHLADGVMVPTGPVMHMPLGMLAACASCRTTATASDGLTAPCAALIGLWQQA